MTGAAENPSPSDGKAPVHTRFCRGDRFATSCSVLSALSQLDQLGVGPEDIRLILEDRRRYPYPEILEQTPPPGTPVRHGTEVTLRVAADGLLQTFPEGLFISLRGAEGRQQREAARKLFAPFDKQRLLALSRLRHWNAVFSGAHRDEEFGAFIFRALAMPESSLTRALRVFSPQGFRDWTRTLPLLHQIVGDREHVARILERFLGDPVSVEVGAPVDRPLPMECSLQLTSGPERRRAISPLAGAPSGEQRAVLAQAVLGRHIREIGSRLQVRIGPLAPSRIQRFAGMPLCPVAGRRGGEIAFDLGPVCEFERYWREGVEPFDTTIWPLLLHLLEHLLPAHVTAEIRLLPVPGTSWKLGSPAGDSAAASSGLTLSTLGAGTFLDPSPMAARTDPQT